VAEDECELGILGICNRTENWKTACYFAPFFGQGANRLVERLTGEHVESKREVDIVPIVIVANLSMVVVLPPTPTMLTPLLRPLV